MNLSEQIERLTSEYPFLRWLLRDGGNFRDPDAGNYMAHIFDEEQGYAEGGAYLVSFVAYAETPEEAFATAYELAKANEGTFIGTPRSGLNQRTIEND